MNTEQAFAQYENVRASFPSASFPAASKTGRDLSDTVDDFDAYILDAFGVLNRGETPIEGAVERIAELRAKGKRLVVLTNAASYTREKVLAKYHRLGFDFTADEVVSSRDVAFAALPAGNWAAAATEADDFSDAPEGVRLGQLLDDPSLYDTAGGFILLSSERWQEADTERLIAALKDHPRPLVVANPDLVAPREHDLSIEPGTFAHRIAAETGVTPDFYGKPFGNAFGTALARLNGIDRSRIAMVGDTLHTDVLGGAAAGIGSILITDHGLFSGQDVTPFIEASGIRPSWIVSTT
ncbi:HAD-IIA family hydrolase [Marivivens donghaensis]|nr:HAD-IIA family hydrolase [Marivivens donghaensis]